VLLLFQIIVDECGMCTEAECLIPIVSSLAKQVVLIGDQQQLQPIILERTSKKCGLNRSLFERYSDKAVMLTTQYRMVCLPKESFNYLNKKHQILIEMKCCQQQPNPAVWPWC